MVAVVYQSGSLSYPGPDRKSNLKYNQAGIYLFLGSPPILEKFD